MGVVFTFPGKIGDTLLQWPVAYHWAKQAGKQFECWVDRKCLMPLVPLLQAQPCVSDVKPIDGVENYTCGGQPFHMNIPTSAFNDNTIYHLGLRSMPARQITLETMQVAKVPVTVDQSALSSEPSIVVPGANDRRNRLILHGMPIYPHSNTVPRFWKFLAGVRGELEQMFDEIVFVGTARDCEIGVRTYPNWGAIDDGGNFLLLAKHLKESRAVIACGSSVAALGGTLKIPTIRVHDPVANDAPKAIWDNLGDNQLNDTEIGLRKSWPIFRDKYLLDPVAAKS